MTKLHEFRKNLKRGDTIYVTVDGVGVKKRGVLAVMCMWGSSEREIDGALCCYTHLIDFTHDTEEEKCSHEEARTRMVNIYPDRDSALNAYIEKTENLLNGAKKALETPEPELKREVRWGDVCKWP